MGCSTIRYNIHTFAAYGYPLWDGVPIVFHYYSGNAHMMDLTHTCYTVL